MKKSKSDTPRQTTIDGSILFPEIWLKIFMHLNVKDRAMVSVICKTWKQVSSDPSLWHRLDLSRLDPDSLKVKLTDVRCGYCSNQKLLSYLKSALSLSNGSTSCLIFNFCDHLRDVHLISAAERTPNLKRLVFPLCGYLSEHGIHNSMKSWRDLESITITSLVKYHHIFSAIKEYCHNIIEIKFAVFDDFELYHADALVKYMPNLKKLSIRHNMVEFEALTLVLNSLKYLEAVNVCHSFILNMPEGRGGEINENNLEDMKSYFEESSFKKLIYCDRSTCLRCKNKEANKYSEMEPYRVIEDHWRQDEITSLSH